MMAHAHTGVPHLPARRRVVTRMNAQNKGEGKVTQVSLERRNFLKRVATGLVGTGIVSSSGAALAAEDRRNQSVASSRMSYSRFLEYLDLDRVKKVDLYDQG